MKQLVIRAQQERDAEAFIELMEQNRQSMLKVAKSYLSCEADVADAMQETILACYEKLDTLRQPEYFKTWLIRILINKCKDILLQRRDVESQPKTEDAGTSADDYANVEFMELLGSLDEKYRTILVLYYAEGFNTREIADMLQLNEHTVKSRLVRARKKFAQEYHEEGAVIL